MQHPYAHSTTMIDTEGESVVKDPNVFISRRSQELELCCGALWRSLHLDLQIHPAEQQLQPAYHLQHTYVDWVFKQQVVDVDFLYIFCRIGKEFQKKSFKAFYYFIYFRNLSMDIPALQDKRGYSQNVRYLNFYQNFQSIIF